MYPCRVPFCEHSIAKKSYVYCWAHRAENLKYNRKAMELVMPLWSVKNCKVHGHLRRNETRANRSNPSRINSPRCKKCLQIRDPYCPKKAKFYNDKNKDQRRNAHLRREYGISIDEYEKMRKRQKNLCAICNLPQVAFDKKTEKVRDLAVDHNHETGQVRSLLCTSCNTGIGLFKDDVELLKKVIKYLRRHETA